MVFDMTHIPTSREYGVVGEVRKNYLRTPVLLRPLYVVGYEINLGLLRKIRRNPNRDGVARIALSAGGSHPVVDVLMNEPLDELIRALENRPWKL